MQDNIPTASTTRQPPTVPTLLSEETKKQYVSDRPRVDNTVGLICHPDYLQVSCNKRRRTFTMDFNKPKPYLGQPAMYKNPPLRPITPIKWMGLSLRNICGTTQG